ncbi:MAG: hypothetical protein ACK5P5_07830 [Pseudobdellovibrionaceae bacterium]
MKTKLGFALFILFSFSKSLFAQNLNARGFPITVPSSQGQAKSLGIKGSAGVGFTDFVIVNPATNFKMDRGTYVTAQLERSFNFAHLYFTMNLSQMNAEGTANYNFTDLAASQTYQANNLRFTASLLDLSLGFKLKIIDEYWFRPYIEGGGVGSYYQIKYANNSTLDAAGAWKKNDVMMGSGGYGEAGIEVQFSDLFGMKFGARYSDQQSKDLVTQNNEKLKLRTETYYVSAILGF